MLNVGCVRLMLRGFNRVILCSSDEFESLLIPLYMLVSL